MNLHLLTKTSDKYHGADLINISLRNAATKTPSFFLCMTDILLNVVLSNNAWFVWKREQFY